jgi:membrane-associated phospholipid phosphatase
VRVAHFIDRWDDDIDRRWDRWRGQPAVDRLFYSASEAGNFSVIWHLLGLILAFAHTDPMIAVVVSVGLAVESALVNGPVKAAFRRSRPIPEGNHPYRLRTPLTSSFPSGHASAAMVAAALLSRQGLTPLWYAVAAIVALSRIHVRLHHASDVAGGLLIGFLLGEAARALADVLV